MKVTVLGCSGAIGGPQLRTTSLLIDQDILVDAGTGVGDLSLEQMRLIDHVFLTHAHLDHIACLPLLIDAVGGERQQPLVVYAQEETLQSLRKHIFNWTIWPDFSELPSKEAPWLRFETIRVGIPTCLNGREITAIPAVHTISAVGYQLNSGAHSLVFTGDTTVNPAFWPVVNAIENLVALVIETAFPDEERELAILSRHLCPSLLAEELGHLDRPAEVWITHVKPSQAALTLEQITRHLPDNTPRILDNDHVFEL